MASGVAPAQNAESPGQPKLDRGFPMTSLSECSLSTNLAARAPCPGS
jgi:hypothetical protein